MPAHLSSFELNVLYAIAGVREASPKREITGLHDYFSAFDGTLDKSKRFTLISPSANSLRLFYNKAALPPYGFPREQFKALCDKIKNRLLQISKFIIELEKQKLIIPEYKIQQYINPSQKEALPWRVYNEFFPDEAPPILYVKSLKPIPSKELYKLLEF
ncbi:MAG: hypothetical protein LBG72_06385 [Spirochaetaceae bacterium]|jgi:hypothetical protein|nr:hypothetical protein [Spirochaetaceae bacterium]